ncbi:MAG: hypothetical protein ACTSRA_22915, partial [Promethearchaeota archaeon]
EKLRLNAWCDALNLGIKYLEMAISNNLKGHVAEAHCLISEIVDDWYMDLNARLIDIHYLALDDDFFNALSELDRLYKEAIQVGYHNIAGEIYSLLNETRRKFQESLKENTSRVEGLLKAGRFDEAISLLTVLRAHAGETGFSDFASELQNWQETAICLQNMTKTLNISNRMCIDDLASILKMDRKQLISFVFDWSEYTNIMIDGDYIITKCKANVDSFITDLDQQFSEWFKREKNKKCKI